MRQIDRLNVRFRPAFATQLALQATNLRGQAAVLFVTTAERCASPYPLSASGLQSAGIVSRQFVYSNRLYFSIFLPAIAIVTTLTVACGYRTTSFAVSVVEY